MSYGTVIYAPQLTELLDLQLAQSDLPPLCIWGKHGIGKTQIVRDYAAERGLEFCYLAPGQFEELGDLLGMPAIEDGRTVLQPPAWVPTDTDAGILLLDDLNRADDRILRGLMPLLQGYGMVSWRLPSRWRIVCTANPDDGSYSVSPLDPAITTRLMHVQLEFSFSAWADWARQNNIAERDIHFLKQQPEVPAGERSTARTFSQFFAALRALSPEKDTADQWRLLGAAFLDEATAAAYVLYREQYENHWIDPQQYLAGKVTERALAKLLQQGPHWQTNFGQDLLQTLQGGEIRIDSTVQSQILRFLQAEDLSPAYRLQFGRDLATIDKAGIKKLLETPEFGKLILG